MGIGSGKQRNAKGRSSGRPGSDSRRCAASLRRRCFPVVSALASIRRVRRRQQTPVLEVRRIPWGNKGLAGVPDLLIRTEFRADVVPALQGALLIDRAPAFFIQKRTRMHASCFVNLQVYGLSGVRKSSATLIDLVFKRTFFTGIHRMFPPVRLLASPRMFFSTGPSYL